MSNKILFQLELELLRVANNNYIYNKKWNALKCWEPSPALMQMTCAYLISMYGILKAHHFSQNGWE